MEELTTALPPPRHRPRRHRRKASDSATYGDVFGGGPRFEAPSAGVPYSDVFGGVAASCSIPYLDLPPAAAGRDDGAGKYGEIFARFDFGEFAAPYEDVFAEEQGMAEEIASWSGSSRSSIRKESGELDAEPSLLYQHYPNVVYGQQFDEEQFSPISLPSGGEQQFSMSYNKATRGRLDDLVEITTCMVEPSISYVVDSCNLSNDSETNHVPAMENDTLANGENKEMSPSPLSASSESVAHEQQHVSSCPPTSENQEQQHVSSCPPTSENLYEDEKDQRRSSTHSASSEEVPSPDYPFLRVSNTSIQTPPIKVQPPSMLPSNLLDKKESKANRDSEVNPNSAAAAAIKEAMDFAEARLKAAKELMERKGDSFKLRKRSGHHRGTKSTEIKEEKSSEEVYVFEEKQTFRRLGGEETNHDDLAFLDKHRDSSEVKMADCYHEEKGVLPPGKSQQMMESGSKLDQLGNWASGAGFYDMVSHDQKCTTNTAACRDDNGLTANLFTKHNQSEKAKEGVTTGDLGRYGKFSAGNDIKELRMQCVNPREDDAAFMGGEHKASTPPDDNGLTANLFTKHQSEKANEGVTTGDLERYGNLSDGNDIKELRMQCVNPREDDAASMEGEHKAFTPPEVPLREERTVYQETTDSHINKYVGKSNSPKGHDNDGIFEISSINGIPVPDVSSLSLEACISGGHANGKKNYCDASTEETPPVGKPNNENNNEEGLEIPCAETPCTSVKNQISDEHLEVPYINETETSQVKVAKLEEPAEYYETHCSQKMSSTVHREAETYEKDKVFSFVGEPCLQNEKEKITEVPSEIIIHEEMKKFETEEAGRLNEAKVATLEEPVEYYETQCFQDMLSTVHREGETYEKDELFDFVDEARLQNVREKKTEVPLETLIHEEVKKFETEEKTGPREDFQEEDVYWDAGSSEKSASDTPRSLNSNANDEAEVLNVFVEDCELMESNVGTCGSFAEDSDQLPESQGSLLRPKDLENKMDGVENLVSHGNLREAKQNLSENSEKTLVEEMLNHDKESQASMEPGTNKGLNDVYAEIIAKNHREGNVLHSETEVITDDYNDYTMKMSTCSKDLQSSFSEACTSMPHLSQGAESISDLTSGENTPFVENLEDCRKSDNEISTLRYTSLEGKTTVDKMQERDGKDRKLSLDLKDQSFAEDSASKFAQRSRKEIPDAQRVEGRDDIRKKERENENEASLRPDKDKESECKMEKEQSKEKARRELEEEKEQERDRERERAKDRLAVQRATREAHERAFAEARATAERIALERITSSRQKASAEARGKDKASDEPAAEKASREARIKAERAAVERATAEARERAIGKAKAAADAKERIEKVRSSFKDSCKATNQETQFQKTASNNYGSSDSCNQEAEYESALRHKARSERHQRTAERAEKALAEKNMRDMLAQREQAEKHRLAEFLDPEVKRWSNGKEGNLRALLSTLQYILGSDSGWQSVPLTDLITAAGVKKAYRKATLCVHPDKVQQRGATIRQKYICEKVFDLLKEAWNKFNSGER